MSMTAIVGTDSARKTHYGVARGGASHQDEHHQMRERLTERWVQRRLGKIEHERRVVEISATLFDLTRHLHGLGAADRRRLRLAALVHDVGRKIDDDRHPLEGERMIARDAFLPLSASERRLMCYLTRFHRGAVPEINLDGILHPGDGRRAGRILLALLRAADALDNRQIPPPQLVFAVKGKRLAITCFVAEPTPKAVRVYSRRKKFRLIEDELGCRITVEIRSAEAVVGV